MKSEVFLYKQWKYEENRMKRKKNEWKMIVIVDWENILFDGISTWLRVNKDTKKWRNLKIINHIEVSLLLSIHTKKIINWVHIWPCPVHAHHLYHLGWLFVIRFRQLIILTLFVFSFGYNDCIEKKNWNSVNSREWVYITMNGKKTYKFM